MGWKGSETKIPVGMIFKKMFCHKCGAKLKKEKISETYEEGDQEYSNKILGHSTLGMSQITKSYYIYKCPSCGAKISYECQCAIAKKQKLLKKKILNEDE